MNCRPDELAVVVRLFPTARTTAIGKIVRTIALHKSAHVIAHDGQRIEVADVWHVEYRGATERGGFLLAVPDACLKPIRDPGEDAVDEMVTRLGIAPPTLTEVMQWSAS